MNKFLFYLFSFILYFGSTYAMEKISNFNHFPKELIQHIIVLLSREDIKKLKCVSKDFKYLLLLIENRHLIENNLECINKLSDTYASLASLNDEYYNLIAKVNNLCLEGQNVVDISKKACAKKQEVNSFISATEVLKKKNIKFLIIQDLINLNLSEISLNHCNLYKSKLIGVNLCKAKLNKVNFNKAHLENIDLYEAQATNTNFTEARCLNVSFLMANIENACFNNANLESVRFNGVTFFKNVKFNNANFKNVSICNSGIFNNVVFENADLSGTNFKEVIYLDDNNEEELEFSLETLKNLGAKWEETNPPNISLINYEEYINRLENILYYCINL
jgi:uncharacterized protein YjbI with pentapeptide repeats